MDVGRPAWLHGVDDVPWGEMSHAFGTAHDVPELLAGLADPDPATAHRKLLLLRDSVRHQGGTTMPAAAAVPFLIDGAADPAVHDRGALLRLAADASRRDYFGHESRADLLVVARARDYDRYDVSGARVGDTLLAARAAIDAHVPTLIELLSDGDADVRANAAYALSALPAPRPEVTVELEARLAVEADPAVRISLILARATFAPIDADRRWQDATVPDDVRFGSAVAWLGTTEDEPPPALIDLLAGCPGSLCMSWTSPPGC